MSWIIRTYANGKVWIDGLANQVELSFGDATELTDEEWRDVRLIAEAPELLAACRAIVEADRIAFECGPDSEDCYIALCEATDKARAAIEKIDKVLDE